MPRMVGVLFSGSDCPFKVTGGCELGLCLSSIKRMIEDLCGDADILFRCELLFQLCSALLHVCCCYCSVWVL